MAAKILVIDNYDSFVFNLVQYLQQLGAECTVVRNDAVAADAASSYDGVLISPGPGTPEKAGVSVAMIKHCAEHSIPLFGVCLGHQAIGAAFGGKIVRAQQIMHGKTSDITHTGSDVFKGLPSPYTVIRYHSLAIERASIPECLAITAQTADGEIMGVRHKTLPIYGVQFHPESILSEHGHALLRNFLELDEVKA